MLPTSESEPMLTPFHKWLDETLSAPALRAAQDTLRTMKYDRDALLEEIKGLRAGCTCETKCKCVGPKPKHPHHEWAAEIARNAAQAWRNAHSPKE